MAVAIVLLVLGALMSSIFIVSKVINYSSKTIIFKAIASLFFVALGVYCALIIPGHTSFKMLIVLGLLFGLLGDVFLGYKYIAKNKKALWILAGLFTFLFGHLFYIIALFTEYYIAGHAWFIVLPFVTSAVLSVVYIFIAKRIGVDFGKLLPFGLFYLACLTSMLSTAFYMALLHNFSTVTLVMILGGALFFVASDFMLTGAYFKPGQRPKAYLAVYSVCYYLAQFIIAFSLFFLV